MLGCQVVASGGCITQCKRLPHVHSSLLALARLVHCRLVHRQTLRELEQTAIYQRRILAAAVQLVRPGGALVFSTCSINPGGHSLVVCSFN